MQSAAARRTQAVGMLVLANVCWGLSFPLVKALAFTETAQGAEGWFVSTMTVAPRFVMAAAVLVMVLGLRWGRRMLPTRREWVQGLGIAAFAAGGMLFQNDGLQYTSASTSAFITQLYAVLIPLWIGWRTRRWPHWPVWAAVGVGLVGTAVLAGLTPGSLSFGRGELETVICSLFFMGQILLLSRQEHEGTDPLRLTVVMFVSQAVFFSLMAAMLAPRPEMLWQPWVQPAWLGCTLALTVFCTLGSYVLMNIYQPRIPATEAGLLYCLEPVFTALWVLWLPACLSRWCGVDYANESMTWNLVIGGALLTAANVIVQLVPADGPPSGPGSSAQEGLVGPGPLLVGNGSTGR